MSARTQQVMPPDAGVTNSGTASHVGQCGRGIQRTGDIRHVGDISGPTLLATTRTPGTNSFSVLPDSTAGQQAPGATRNPFGLDSQAQVTSGAYAGFDGSGEGFDGYSSKNGLDN